MEKNRWNLFLRTWKSLDLRQLRLHWLSVLAAFSTFATLTYSIWSSVDVIRLAAWLAMGISFLLVPSLIFDKESDVRRRNIARAIFAAVLFALIFSSRMWSDGFFVYKILHGFLIAHLLVSLTPYIQGRLQGVFENREKYFWSENWFLLNRIHMAAMQTILLFAGTCVALFSVAKLFDVNIVSDVYATFAAFYLVMMSTLLFVGSLGERKTLIEPFEILKRLVRTVLTPLAVTYLCILYAYTIKIVLAHEWPRGGIGYLVSGLAVIVTFGYLIMRPLADSQEFGTKLKMFWRISFRLLIPPVLLLILGLTRRVSEYGWTEERVLLGTFALWMAAISFYYWNPNRRSVVAIPLSLASVFLVTWFGPLSPSFISKMSQTSRLREILQSDRKSLSESAKLEAKSVLEYLCRLHGTEAVKASSGVDVSSKLPQENKSTAAACHLTIVETMKAASIDVLDADILTGVRTKSLKSRDRPFAHFEQHDFADLIFNSQWEGAGREWMVKPAGMVQFRLNTKLPKLEWNTTESPKENWRDIPLQAAIELITEDKTHSEETYSDKRLHFRDTVDGYEIEVRIVGANIAVESPVRFTSLRIHSLARSRN